MSRFTTFCFTFDVTVAVERAFRRNAGAARFAYNQLLRLVTDALAKKQNGADVHVPWTGFDLINGFNRWKRSPEAGVDEVGSPGLPWRGEVLQEVFEEAAVDLGRALEAFRSHRTAGSKAAGFPRFKRRTDPHQSFRIRNEGRSGCRAAAIRVGDEGRPRTIRLPKLGVLAVREDTRKLRRMLAKGRARILFATVSRRAGGRWTRSPKGGANQARPILARSARPGVGPASDGPIPGRASSLNVEAESFHPARMHHVEEIRAPVGLDRGLQTFAVLADAGGHEVERLEAPRPLREAMPKLRRLSRAVARKQKGSQNRRRARERLARFHHRIGSVRRDFVHRASTRLAKTHGRLVLETLGTVALMQGRLARSLADSAWAMFARVLAYKVEWSGGTLSTACRYFPSTRRCSACGNVGDAVPLSERTFRCRRCGHEADRDVNAAANLAQYPGLSLQYVAAKQAETRNVCREESAGAWARPPRETVPDDAERAVWARRPRRAVLTATVNTL